MIEQNLEDYDGTIAVLDCKYVGGSAYLWPVDGSVYLWTEHDVYKLKIFDCANPLDDGDVRMDDNGIGEEVALMIGCDDFERNEICQIMHEMSSQ